MKDEDENEEEEEKRKVYERERKEDRPGMIHRQEWERVQGVDERDVGRECG